MTRELPVAHIVDMLYIQHNEVGRGYQPVEASRILGRERDARGIEAGVDAFLLCFFKKLRQEVEKKFSISLSEWKEKNKAEYEQTVGEIQKNYPIVPKDEEEAPKE